MEGSGRKQFGVERRGGVGGGVAGRMGAKKSQETCGRFSKYMHLLSGSGNNVTAGRWHA